MTKKVIIRDERGITGLETAIILVAFVVVAAVFSFAVLSAGTFATQKSEEAVYAGLEGVRSTAELKGSIIAESNAAGSSEGVDIIKFTIVNVAGGAPIDLSPRIRTTGVPTNVLVINYLDENQRYTDLCWDVSWPGEDDGDGLLEEGESAEISVTGNNITHTFAATNDQNLGLGTNLSISTDFALEVKPSKGAVLRIEKRTPDYINQVMLLD